MEVMARHCIRAATKILQLFKRLYISGNMSQFSFTDFQGVSIASIVLLLASILDSDETTERLIEFGLDCLRSLAAGNSSAEMGVEFVQKFRDIVEEAAERLRSARVETPDRQPQPGLPTHTTRLGTEEYHAWLSWSSNRHDANTTAANPTRQHQSSSMSTLVPPAQNPLSSHDLIPETITPGATENFQFPADTPYLDPLCSSATHGLSERGNVHRSLTDDRSGNEEFSLLDLTGFDVLNWAEFVG
jgi:hypothetical protein